MAVKFALLSSRAACFSAVEGSGRAVRHASRFLRGQQDARLARIPQTGGWPATSTSSALLPILPGSMMRCMGFSETLVLVVLAYLLFGPKKLPEIARAVGKALNEFKRASNEFKAQIASEISQLELETQRQQILPPAEPPAGSVTAGSQSSPDTTTTEPHSLLKAAPDA